LGKKTKKKGRIIKNSKFTHETRKGKVREINRGKKGRTPVRTGG